MNAPSLEGASLSIGNTGADGRAIVPVDVNIDSISVAYGDTMPVRDLSLHVRRGEFLSLLGPSGCGKTTTLRAVAGFVMPAAGDIRIGGQSVIGVPPNRRNIGMVYQDYALFPHMTVAENIAFGMKMRSVPKAEIAPQVQRILGQLQLAALGHRYPSQLSGGQQQRVALARALVFNPSVLLLDEPLAALDKQLRGDMQFELRELQRRFGITTIFVTHDQEEALSLSDRIAVLSQGAILQVDTPRQVYDFPAHRFVAEFIGTANMLSGRVVGRGDGASRIELDGVAGTFAQAGQHGDGAVQLLLRPERIQIAPAAAPLPAGRNAMRGKVVNSVFVGTTIKYQVGLGGDLLLRVDAPADLHTPAMAGDEVTLAWRPEDARLFRDDRLET
ncbi:ABC transporter ATP-binding protein [Ferrovibrio sp. MS7]|uniref:ABC transporter ATP-binding protein n=1 Tax=Ferrovibrio plantarum TaxID=3119164 RepID=UPI003135D4B2